MKNIKKNRSAKQSLIYGVASTAMHTKQMALSAASWGFIDALAKQLGVNQAAVITLLVERYKASV